MLVYSTCPTCRLLLDTAGGTQSAHVNCYSMPRDALVDLYLKAVENEDDAEADRLAAILDRPIPPPRLLDAALAYVSWGWPVFPILPGAKTPATRHGLKDASTDPAQIRDWWRRTPRANVGLPTGISFDVIDIDAPDGWWSWLHIDAAGALPAVHGKVSTPRSGTHLYVTPTGKGNTVGTLPGVDYRGKGGYVVAPPSVDGNGRRYMWQHPPSPLLRRSA